MKLALARAWLLAAGLLAAPFAQAQYFYPQGKPMKKLGHPHRAIVQGDGTSLSIAMASILAKTLRDQLMLKLDEDFPQYGFVKHKGYGTPQHLEALRHHGPCPHHRPRFLRNLDI